MLVETPKLGVSFCIRVVGILFRHFPETKENVYFGCCVP